MSSGQLMLRTQGGFCNRLRAIVSGVLWAEDLDRKLAIYWPDEPGHLPCELGELLVPNSIPHLCCVHAGYLSQAHAVQSLEEMLAVLRVVGTEGEEIRIESYSSFHPDTFEPRGLSVLRSIRIQPVIEDLANRMWNEAKCDSKMIGVHFRGTDHRKCLAKSPLEAFVSEMNKHLDEISGLRFLVCTDEHSVAEYLKRTYGNRVVVPIEVRGRRYAEQQVLGVVDWLLLHRCSTILGSSGSSFSELAAARSGATLIPVEAHSRTVN